MKIFCVVTIARQLEGDILSVKFEKAFLQASKADDYAKSLATNYTENVSTPNGMIQFVCQRAVYDIDVEE